MATRTRKTTAKKTATAAKKTIPVRKPAAKKALPKTAPVNDTTTVVDVRPPLPVRRKVFVGPMGVTEQAAIRAALASAKAALRIPVSAWHGPIAHIADDLVLTHTPAHATTDQTPTFRAAITCPHGAIHPYTIHTVQELHRARLLTAQCAGCIKKPEETEPEPKTVVRALGDTLAHATSATAETQPMPLDDIAAGLTARAEQAKEHPEP